MKISIIKIDDVFYCGVRDIARLKTRKGKRTSTYQEIINLYKRGILTLRFDQSRTDNYEAGINTFKDIINNKLVLDDGTLFVSGCDFDNGTLLKNGVYRVAQLKAATPSNKSISVEAVADCIDEMAGFFVDGIYQQNGIKPSVFLVSQGRKLSNVSFGVSDSFFFLVRLIDVYDYLADILTDGDFYSDYDITVGDIATPSVVDLFVRNISTTPQLATDTNKTKSQTGAPY